MEKEIGYIKLYNLKLKDLPLKIVKYNSNEGSDGFAIFTIKNFKVELEDGSYGYDTFYYSEKKAAKSKKFIEKSLK